MPLVSLHLYSFYQNDNLCLSVIFVFFGSGMSNWLQCKHFCGNFWRVPIFFVSQIMINQVRNFSIEVVQQLFSLFWLPGQKCLKFIFARNFWSVAFFFHISNLSVHADLRKIIFLKSSSYSLLFGGNKIGNCPNP